MSALANLQGLIGIAGMLALAQDRRGEVAALGLKSRLSGNMASPMTGVVIGLVTWG